MNQERQIVAAEQKQDAVEIEASVRDYLCFEEATSVQYPFLKMPEQISAEEMSQIVELCGGSDDTEVIYQACIQVLGNACEANPQREMTETAKPGKKSRSSHSYPAR